MKLQTLELAAVLLASAFHCAFGVGFGGGGQDGDWTYSLNNNQATITGYTGPGGAVTVPLLVNGMPVVQIGSQNGYDSFLGLNKTSVTAVTITFGVKRIGNYAFNNCGNLAIVNMPSSITDIGAYAFQGTKIESVSIPASVTAIGESALYSCTRLSYISVNSDNSIYSSDADGVLFNKDKTVLIQYPAGKEANSYAIPEGVTTIGSQAFSRCNRLVHISIPNSVSIIGSYAFYDCPWLASVNLPESVTVIGDNAFHYCTSLSSINIPNSVNKIEDGTFDSCYSLVNLTGGSNVTSIGNYAFYSCGKLAGISIPNSVISIGDFAFFSCTSLNSINIPDRVVILGVSAFDSCNNLANLTIGKDLISIGNRALYSCTSLSSISVDSNNSNYSSDTNGVLFNKDKTVLIQYPAGRTADSYAIPKGVTTISSLAFHLCRSLVNVAFPDEMTNIADNAFLSCISLTSISFANNLASIGSHAFDYCVELTNIELPKGVTNIGSYAFSSCYKLRSITIPSSVNWIGEQAFSGCLNLTHAIFQGNAPFASPSSFSYTSAVIYYYPEKTGWGSTFAGQPTILLAGPSIKSLNVTPNGVLQLTWRAVPDVSYVIQTTDKLTNAFVSRYTRRASATLETWSDPQPDSAVMRFYRVGLLQP